MICQVQQTYSSLFKKSLKKCAIVLKQLQQGSFKIMNSIIIFIIEINLQSPD